MTADRFAWAPEDIDIERVKAAAAAPARFGAQANHPECPAGRPHATVHVASGEPVMCHVTKRDAQDLALTLNFPDAPGGTMEVGAAGPVMPTSGNQDPPYSTDTPKPDSDDQAFDDAPFGVQADHPECPGSHPFATTDNNGHAIFCHVTADGAQGLADTMNTLPDVESDDEPMAPAAAAKGGNHGGNAEALHRYWGTGEGAAKIRWGTPGDHMRCVRELVDDAKFTPEQAHGYCNLMEKRVTGRYPAQHAHDEKAHHASGEDAWQAELSAAAPGSPGDLAAAITHRPAGTPQGGQFAPGAGGPAPTNAQPVAQGETGTRVSDLQKRLNELGAHLTVDGKFGPKTAAALRAYQQAHGLKVDGLAGPKTTASLRLTDHQRHVAHQTRTKHAAAPPVPALVTIPGVDLLAAGTWKLSTGRQTFTRDDLGHAVEASRCPAVGPPVIKIGHLDKRFAPPPDGDGEPAIGKVANLRLNDRGDKVVGDLAGMPGWLGTIAASAFPRRSIEGKYGFHCQVGHDHPFVISALALLGVTRPGVGVLSELGDIAALYGMTPAAAAAPAATAWRTEPTEQTGAVMPVTEEDVRRAFFTRASVPPAWWITELQMAPAQLIVADDTSGKIYRVPFRVDGSTVDFGDPAEVASYADVAASRGTGMVVTYASAAESRSLHDDPGETEEDDEDDDGGGEEDNGTEPVQGAVADHGPVTTKGHSHPHPAYDSQGGDQMHEHVHSHNGDAVHDHTHTTAAADGAATPTEQEDSTDMGFEFSSDQMAAIRQRLGKKAGEPVTSEEIAAAMATPAAPTLASAAGDEPVDVPPITDGAYVIDGEILKGYQERALAGDRAVMAMRVAERDDVLASAVRDGKFPQSRREHFERLWAKDPEGTRKLVDTLASGLVPMGGPMGSAGEFATDPDMPGDFEAQQAYNLLYPDDRRGGVSAAPGVRAGGAYRG